MNHLDTARHRKDLNSGLAIGIIAAQSSSLQRADISLSIGDAADIPLETVDRCFEGLLALEFSMVSKFSGPSNRRRALVWTAILPSNTSQSYTSKKYPAVGFIWPLGSS